MSFSFFFFFQEIFTFSLGSSFPGHFGKYLNEYDGTWVPVGWKRWEGLQFNSKFYNYVIRHNTYKERRKMSYEDDYFTDFITNRSISFIKRTRATRPESPFLAVISHAAPHGPETPAPQYSTAFPDAQAPRYDLRLKRDASVRPRLLWRKLFPGSRSYLGLTYDQAFFIIFSRKGKKRRTRPFPLVSQTKREEGPPDRRLPWVSQHFVNSSIKDRVCGSSQAQFSFQCPYLYLLSLTGTLTGILFPLTNSGS